MDRRRLPYRQAVRGKSILVQCPQQEFQPCLARVTNPMFQDLLEYDSMFVEYCLYSFLPSQYHHAADGSPTVDLSYLRYMCLTSRLLFKAVSACASGNRRQETTLREFKHCPDGLYMAAVSELAASLARGTLSGSEDALLATVLWLCVYEVRLFSAYSCRNNFQLITFRILELIAVDKVRSMRQHFAKFYFFARQRTIDMLRLQN